MTEPLEAPEPGPRLEPTPGHPAGAPAIECLLSLPPSNANLYGVADGADRANKADGAGGTEAAYYSTCDPPGRKLGSGGGTAHLLVEAWRARGADLSFGEWLARSRKLLVHGGGQSRRLPAYAVVGKPLIPVPVLEGSYGQRLDQTLLDLQVATYRRVLARASARTVAMVTSGDVLLRFGGELPPLPEVDVLLLGMEVDAETASHFGVFFQDRKQPDRLAFFLQKPSEGRINELTAEHQFLVDTGMWLLSERAVAVLLERCCWDGESNSFIGGAPALYELYSEFGLSLGAAPQMADPLVQSLTSAVVALPEPEFYHLGTSRQLIESVCALQNREARRAVVGGTRAWPQQVVQNAVLDRPLHREANRLLWIENSTVPARWQLASEHVLTGVPDNDWPLCLEPGVCLDFVPVDERDWCVRIYGFDDAFSGALGQASTRWLGRPAAQWLVARGIGFNETDLDLRTDIHDAPLFCVLSPEELDPAYLEWLFAAQPVANPEFARRWLAGRRLSAAALGCVANLARLSRQREANGRRALQRLRRSSSSTGFYRLDLQSTAGLFATGDEPLPPLPEQAPEALARIHEHMWRAAVLRRRGALGGTLTASAAIAVEESQAFACLREAILSAIRSEPARPVCTAQSDQIVWGRAPVRLDLAGGWTDTPPYCLQHGGQVTNVAVDLNGQPPIQVFAKPSSRPEIVIRSIDLGAEEHITTYEQLGSFDRPGSEFALAKGVLALAGFLPRFNAEGGFSSLAEQLKAFGGGLELSLLAAVPAGSGLGTSSILAATLLKVLADLCGLGWDEHAVIARTLALEQLLTTGGGWQDQVGGILRGVKLAETAPGFRQAVTVRWLPEYLFAEGCASRVVLLYYTGLTRLAKNILQEIVRGMFLNDPARLEILGGIGRNATFVADALQRADWPGLCEGIRRSWRLNQRLDAGTNPPAVQAIIAPVADWLAGCKLLGAGGGGFLLMLAKDEPAARRILQRLTESPPNNRARFVDLAVSRTGLEVTRS